MKIKRQTKKQYYNRDKQCIICNKPTKTYNAKTCSKYCREVVTQLLVSLNAIYLQCSWCDKLVIRRPNKVRGHETNVHNTRKLAFCDNNAIIHFSVMLNILIIDKIIRRLKRKIMDQIGLL